MKLNSPIIKKFLSNLDEIHRLLGIHVEIAGSTPGRKHNVSVINKSCIVLLVACWEAFIEDLASSAFDIFLENAPTANVFPNRVLTRASKLLRDSSNEADVWKLADSGWRKVISDHKADLLDRLIGKLNTPKPIQVNALFESLFGIPKLSVHWHWKGMSAPKAENNLLKLVEFRGEIAHRVSTSKAVRKIHVEQSLEFVQYLAAKSHNAVRGHILKHVGKDQLKMDGQLWSDVTYKEIG